MSDFHEILFPVDISYGSRGGPKWKTSVFGVDSGYEARVSDWKDTRAEYDVSHAIKSQNQMDRLTAFFYARRGRAYGFRFKDWNDHRAEALTLGHGDWTSTEYQIVKRYESNGPDGKVHSYDRPLRKIAWNSEVDVAVGGVVIDKDNVDPQYYAIDYNTGVVTLGAPMKGGVYTGLAPETLVDFITTGEGGLVNGTVNRTANAGAPPIDRTRNRFYMVGGFTTGTIPQSRGLRIFNLATGAETQQVRGSTMGLTDLLHSLVAVSPVDGSIYVCIGQGNGQQLHRIDPDTLTTVASFGTIAGSASTANVAPSGHPGSVSLNGEFLLHLPSISSGVVGVHDAETLARVSTVLSGPVALACPFRSNGFAIFDHETGTDRIVFYVWSGSTYEAMRFGGTTGNVEYARYDLKTGGLLIGWVENSDEFWCGLWHDRVQDFVWKRRVPALPTGQPDPQTPLNGQMAWASLAATFGRHIFFLDTETGEITGRTCSANFGSQQTHDPAGKRLITVGGTPSIYSLDVDGVTFTDPQALTIDVVDFHVPVRFDIDHLNPKHEFWKTLSWDQIPLVEVRDWNDVNLD